MSNYTDLLKEFFVTDFKLRHKHSYLGLLWVILKPLSYFIVLNLVWTSLFETSVNYTSYLLIGILTITFFTEGVAFGLESLFNKAHIILKVNFPREIVVLSSIAIATLNFLINFCIYLTIRIFNHQPLFGTHWWYFILGTILMIIFLLGISFFISVVSIKFHDIKHLVELLLQLVFWATPVFFKLSQLPTTIGKLIATFNPLVTILNLIRTGVLDDVPIEHSQIMIVHTVAIIFLFVFGFLFFRKNLPKIAEYF